MFTRKVSNRLLSLFLVLAILTPMLLVNPNRVSAVTQTKASNLVTVSVDEDEAEQLKIYRNGVYETGVELSKGEHSYTVSGIAKEVTNKITVPTDQMVYIRYYAKGSSDSKAVNGVVDSINHAYHFKKSATWVGNLTRISDLGISDWKPEDTNGDLDYVGGGIYTKTFQFPALSQDIALEYKVAYNGTWDESIGKDGGNGNIPVTVPKGSTQITIFVDYLNKVCTDSIITPKLTIFQNKGKIQKPAFSTNLSLIGTVRNGDEDWSASKTGYEFTQISPNLYVYNNVFSKGSYEYKGVFDYQFWYESFGGGNIKLQINEDNTNVVFIYDVKEDKFYDTINNYDKVAKYFDFEAAPVVPVEAKTIDNKDGTTAFIMAGKESDKIQLVYAEQSQPNKATTVNLKFAGNGFTSGNLFLGDEEFDIIYYYIVNGKRQLNPNVEKVSHDGQEYSLYKRTKYCGRTVNVPGTFPGPSWDPKSNEMTYLGNRLYSYTFKNVPVAKYEYKIAMESWSENYGVDGCKDGANYSVTVPSAQDVTIYYSDILHRSVTSLNYIFADLTLSGTEIPANTKLTDAGLNGSYSVTIPLKAGEYSGLKIKWADKKSGSKEYTIKNFTLKNEKEVTFFFDPTMELFYCNASDAKIDSSKLYYNSKDSTYKSIFGAIEQNKDVTFSIKTGNDVENVVMIVKGIENKRIPMTSKQGNDGTIWSVTTKFSKYGEYTYFFELVGTSEIKFYGDDDGYYGTGIVTDISNYKPYDLIVYKAGYQTPDWMKNAVVYQIFPDRFYNGNCQNDKAQTIARGAVSYEFPSNWYVWPENPEAEESCSSGYPAKALKGDGQWSNEMYGGDLSGITKRIGYLKALGVNVIYLNPVFSSISSHRYDTTDYAKIDPILGTLGDFKALVEAAKKNNMHIVLDGVFNHVSDDSVYFDRYYKFVGKNGKVGAYPYWAYVYDSMAQKGLSNEDAEKAAKEYFKTKGVTDYSYTQWFDVKNSPLLDGNKNQVCDSIGERKGKPVYGYDGWWGYDSMPVVKSTNGSEYQTGNWAQHIISGSNSTTQYWLSQGSNGWRLDVANEVSDETWRRFRESVKSLSSDNVIIGEIWDDASKYLMGDMYDSVMNYMFRNAVLNYVKGGKAIDAQKTL